MKLFDVLKMMGLAADEIVALLKKLAELAPDSADTVEKWLAKLDEAVSIETLTVLADVLKIEIPNIAQLKFDPRRHPDNVA